MRAEEAKRWTMHIVHSRRGNPSHITYLHQLIMKGRTHVPWFKIIGAYSMTFYRVYGSIKRHAVDLRGWPCMQKESIQNAWHKMFPPEGRTHHIYHIHQGMTHHILSNVSHEQIMLHVCWWTDHASCLMRVYCSHPKGEPIISIQVHQGGHPITIHDEEIKKVMARRGEIGVGAERYILPTKGGRLSHSMHWGD